MKKQGTMQRGRYEYDIEAGKQQAGNILAEVYFRDCLHKIPALEFQHIQSTVYVRDLRFHVGFPLLKYGLTLGIGGRARSGTKP